MSVSSTKSSPVVIPSNPAVSRLHPTVAPSSGSRTSLSPVVSSQVRGGALPKQVGEVPLGPHAFEFTELSESRVRQLASAFAKVSPAAIFGQSGGTAVECVTAMRAHLVKVMFSKGAIPQDYAKLNQFALMWKALREQSPAVAAQFNFGPSFDGFVSRFEKPIGVRTDCVTISGRNFSESGASTRN